MIQPATFKRPTFQQMVKDLFKQMTSHGHGAAMIHAAIGIAGESGELRAAYDQNHILEESGDLEFYVEAAWQSMKTEIRLKITHAFIENNLPLLAPVTLGNVVDNIHHYGAEILDHAKKCWVYEDGNRDEYIAVNLCHLEFQLQKLYGFIGFSREEIQRINQDKLLGNAKIAGRYASGVYSNEQALARADKAVEEPVDPVERKFMSQSKV